MGSHPVKEKGQLFGYLSADQPVRASVVIMTDLIESVCAMQGTTASSSVALGRALIGSVLVSSLMKDKQAVSMQVMGSGPLGRVFAHAQSDGLCRGSLSMRQAPLAFDENGISLKELVGEGILQVSTYLPGASSPQVSQVPLESGEIGEDIALYLSQSLQIPCLLSLGVKIGTDGKVVAAGGVLIELMPGHTPELIQKLEEQQQSALSLSNLIEGKETPLNLLHNFTGRELDMRLVKEHEVEYHCTCSREKAAESLYLLESRDFDEILASPESLNVDCEMCGLTHRFSTEEIQNIYKASGKAPLH